MLSPQLHQHSNIMEHGKQADVSQRLEKYGFGLKTSGFVSFLAWTGMMFGILGILFSLELLILPADFKICYEYLFYTGGILGILTSVAWLALSVALRRRNVKKDFRGIKQILMIKCCITGSFEIILSILGIIVIILMVVLVTSDNQNPVEYRWFIGLGLFLYLIILSYLE